MTRSIRRAVFIAAASCAAGVATLAPAVAAQARPTSRSRGCAAAPVSHPFSRWGDERNYALVPGGDFEGSLGAWTLSGGAAQSSGSETYASTGSVGSSSLLLPKGAGAVSPAVCVTPKDRFFRFFDRTDHPGAVIRVTAVYRLASGTVSFPVGTIRPSRRWRPSPRLQTASQVAKFAGGSANLTLQFRASGGTAQIDDVFVDPWGKG